MTKPEQSVAKWPLRKKINLEGWLGLKVGPDRPSVYMGPFWNPSGIDPNKSKTGPAVLQVLDLYLTCSRKIPNAYMELFGTGPDQKSIQFRSVLNSSSPVLCKHSLKPQLNNQTFLSNIPLVTHNLGWLNEQTMFDQTSNQVSTHNALGNKMQGCHVDKRST